MPQHLTERIRALRWVHAFWASIVAASTVTNSQFQLILKFAAKATI